LDDLRKTEERRQRALGRGSARAREVEEISNNE